MQILPNPKSAPVIKLQRLFDFYRQLIKGLLVPTCGFVKGGGRGCSVHADEVICTESTLVKD